MFVTSIEYSCEDELRKLVEAVVSAATAVRVIGADAVLESCGFIFDGSNWVRELVVEPGSDDAVEAVTLAALEQAIRCAWSRETSEEPDAWTCENPAFGQCAATARVIRDYLGGEIVVAGVVRDGWRVDRHA